MKTKILLMALLVAGTGTLVKADDLRFRHYHHQYRYLRTDEPTVAVSVAQPGYVIEEPVYYGAPLRYGMMQNAHGEEHYQYVPADWR